MINCAVNHAVHGIFAPQNHAGAMLIVAFALCSLPAQATTYFNPVPVIFVQGNPSDTCASNPPACAHAADFNTNFNQLVSDGNNAKSSILTQLSGVTNVGLPSGAVIMMNAANCPFGYAVADGTGGSPDVRGVFVRGLDLGAGVDPGRTLASYQADAIEQHSHGGPAAAGGSSGLGTAAGSSAVSSGVNTSAATIENNTNGIEETRPANVVLLHCFKP